MTQGVAGKTRLLPKGDGRRLAFTLVELMVVILIITLLASIALVTMGGVAEKARTDRTRSQIARLHEMIMEQWESYQTRRVQSTTSTNNRQAIAFSRLLAIRRLMRMELPDRKTDVRDTATATVVWDKNDKAKQQGPALWRAYNRRADHAEEFGPKNEWTTDYQNAECLYMIISRLQIGDSNGLKFFSESEIGDKDEDGMPEILDGWGNPIRFLRWAPGYYQVPALLPPDLANKYLSAHDPLDPLNVENSAFHMIPVIYSLGPDGEDNIVEDINPPHHYEVLPTPNNPYVPIGTPPKQIGALEDDQAQGHLDNISNIFLPTK